VEIRVYDTLGRLVLYRMRGDLAAGTWQEEIDMTSRSSGVYYAEIRVKFEDGGEQRKARKIVLTR
jgi:hypothetical protein